MTNNLLSRKPKKMICIKIGKQQTMLMSIQIRFKSLTFEKIIDQNIKDAKYFY